MIGGGESHATNLNCTQAKIVTYLVILNRENPLGQVQSPSFGLRNFLTGWSQDCKLPNDNLHARDLVFPTFFILLLVQLSLLHLTLHLTSIIISNRLSFKLF